jgi:hypothetical protein
MTKYLFVNIFFKYEEYAPLRKNPIGIPIGNAISFFFEEINGLEQMVCYIIILIVKWKVL